MDLEQHGGLEISEIDESIEDGRYVVQYIDETEMRNDSGWIGIRMTFQIQGPKHEGRNVSGLFTVANTNSAKSVEIGKQELSALASACGLTSMKNTEELRGIRFSTMVKTNDRGYGEIDSDFGKAFQKCEQAEPSIAKQKGETTRPEPIPVDPLDSEEIPF